MKRKIIKQGHNTLTITLPSDWVKKLNLKAGDEIDIHENKDSLILNGNERIKEKKALIDITNFTIPLLWRFFQGAYRSGCDEIKITFDTNKKDYPDAFHYYTTQFDYSRFGDKVSNKPAIAMLQGLVDRFIGMGIIETGKGYCIVKEMGEPTAKEFENSLRRVFLVILQLFERVIEAIENNEINDTSLCKEIHTIDLNIDKFVDYCSRILNKINTAFSDNKKILLFSTLYLLELIGDEFKYIGKHLATSKKSLKEILPILYQIKEHFTEYYSLFYKFNKEGAINLGKKDFEVYSEHFRIKNSLSGEMRSIAKHLMSISKMT
jgi:phosphate uptake regulator